MGAQENTKLQKISDDTYLYRGIEILVDEDLRAGEYGKYRLGLRGAKFGTLKEARKCIDELKDGKTN